jgi:ATP-binding cassette subfamily F protein uup
VFDKKLSQEEAWIRQGIKARRTRNEGRVRRLESMRAERRSRRERAGSVRLSTDTGNRSGNRVIRAEGISFAYAGKPVVRDFSAQIERGDKIGIVGPNGSGKTTLIRLLLGELQPQAGTVTHGTRLQVAYFDQLREQLDLAGTVQENIADGAETVAINGRRQHVISYLKDFLFPADRARSPVSMLSGGERNRLLLARLFTRPFNVLVMDEPTNDLDIETLELLEEMLADYQGTLLLVSHDRAFLDNVVTELLVLEGDGRIASLVGGYADYLQRRQPRPAAARAPAKTAAAAAPANKPRKLLNRERAALTALPGEIEALEQEQAALVARLASAEFHRQPAAAVAEARQRLVAIEAAIHEKFALWEELETLRSESDG